MTVEDLIRELLKFTPEAEVYIDDPELTDNFFVDKVVGENGQVHIHTAS